MGTMVEINDTLQLTTEQGFPAKILDRAAHCKKPITLDALRGQILKFEHKPSARIFQLDPTKLPRYAGAPNERGGYSIYKLAKVIDPPAPDLAKLTAANTRIGEQVGRELLNAYLATLKDKADVKINQANLEKK